MAGSELFSVSGSSSLLLKQLKVQVLHYISIFSCMEGEIKVTNTNLSRKLKPVGIIGRKEHTSLCRSIVETFIYKTDFTNTEMYLQIRIPRMELMPTASRYLLELKSFKKLSLKFYFSRYLFFKKLKRLQILCDFQKYL